MMTPYYVGLGYTYDPETNLFYRTNVRPDGRVANEVLVPAEDFHRIRKHNLTVLTTQKGAKSHD